MQVISNFEFWIGMATLLGVTISLFGTTIGLFMHSQNKWDEYNKESNARWYAMMEKIHNIELEIRDIKLNRN